MTRMVKPGVSAFVALILVIVGSWLYAGLGASEGIAWTITDAVCVLASVSIGRQFIKARGLGRAVGIALLIGAAMIVLFHAMAWPMAGAARTTHPGWKYLDGFNGALWGVVGLRRLMA